MEVDITGEHQQNWG